MGMTIEEMVALRTGVNPHNKDYLAVKVSKLGHRIIATRNSLSQSRSLIVDLLRHGEPEGEISPRQDKPDSDRVRVAADESGSVSGCVFSATASTPHWDTVISSPLWRCREFAERAASAASGKLPHEEQWQEIDYGDWDGMPLNQWRREAADQFRAFRQDPAALAPPTVKISYRSKRGFLLPGRLSAIGKDPAMFWWSPMVG